VCADRGAAAQLRPARVGCSGWNYRHWRGLVYPPGLPARRWLEHYATLFDTVEVNATFYRLPLPRTVAGWVERTPPGFVFAVKASRYLTHVRRLRDLAPGIERMSEALEPLIRSPKLGPILWQLPGSFQRDDERLAAALEALPSGRHAFEFRHDSWFCKEVYALLREHGVALVVADSSQRPCQARELTAPFTFVRLHFGDLADGCYSERALAEWADRIGHWRGAVDVYAYFNNDWAACAVRNALQLRERLAHGARGRDSLAG
jgi:uncharacterized protein YecE (DUF72 family)